MTVNSSASRGISLENVTLNLRHNLINHPILFVLVHCIVHHQQINWNNYWCGIKIAPVAKIIVTVLSRNIPLYYSSSNKIRTRGNLPYIIVWFHSNINNQITILPSILILNSKEGFRYKEVVKGGFAEVIKEDTNVLGVTRVPVEVVDPVEKVCNLIHHLLYLLHPILYPPPPI